MSTVAHGEHVCECTSAAYLSHVQKKCVKKKCFPSFLKAIIHLVLKRLSTRHDRGAIFMRKFSHSRSPASLTAADGFFFLESLKLPRLFAAAQNSGGLLELWSSARCMTAIERSISGAQCRGLW
jgi:hypothetical protein